MILSAMLGSDSEPQLSSQAATLLPGKAANTLHDAVAFRRLGVINTLSLYKILNS